MISHRDVMMKTSVTPDLWKVCVHWAEVTLPGCVTGTGPALGEMVQAVERPAVKRSAAQLILGVNGHEDYFRLTISR